MAAGSRATLAGSAAASIDAAAPSLAEDRGCDSARYDRAVPPTAEPVILGQGDRSTNADPAPESGKAECSAAVSLARAREPGGAHPDFGVSPEAHVGSSVGEDGPVHAEGAVRIAVERHRAGSVPRPAREKRADSVQRVTPERGAVCSQKHPSGASADA